MTESQRAKVMEAAGACNFFCLFLMATAAMAMTFAASGYCNFLNRDLVVNQTAAEEYCSTGQGGSDWSEQCLLFFQDHGIGFYAWQGTVQINAAGDTTPACLSYTQYIPGTLHCARACDDHNNKNKLACLRGANHPNACLLLGSAWNRPRADNIFICFLLACPLIFLISISYFLCIYKCTV